MRIDTGTNDQKHAYGRTNESWAELYRRWTPHLRRTVRACLCDGNQHLKNDAEDVLQCVWIRVFKGLASCRKTGVWAWLKTTARRTTLNYIRDNAAMPNLQDLSLPSDAEGRSRRSEQTSEFIVARGFDGYSKIRHDELWTEVNELPEALRDAISRHIDGFETMETAAAWGVEPAAVRKRLSRARAELRCRLKMNPSARRIPGHRRG